MRVPVVSTARFRRPVAIPKLATDLSATPALVALQSQPAASWRSLNNSMFPQDGTDQLMRLNAQRESDLRVGLKLASRPAMQLLPVRLARATTA